MYDTCHSYQSLMKLEAFRQVFEKLYRNSFSRSRVCEQTDRSHVAVLPTRLIISDLFYFFNTNIAPLCIYIYIRNRNERKTHWAPNISHVILGCLCTSFSCLLHIMALNTQRIRNEYRFCFESMRWLWISRTDAVKTVANRRLVLHQCVFVHRWSGLIRGM